MVIRVAILTVSDTASANPSADKSGPTIKEIVLHNACDVQQDHCRIVPDDVDSIYEVIKYWCNSESLDWIVTTGGTGFGQRDVTPEAILPLIERHASGLLHLMLSSSLQYTPLAALSRPVAGTIGNTLITTLPGSVKAVKENLAALFQGGVLQHAIDLMQGNSGQRVHASLAAGSSCILEPTKNGAKPEHHETRHHDHHHHHHGNHHTPQPRSAATLSHDPSAPVSVRHRNSPYPIISLEKGLGLIRDNIRRLPIQVLPVNHKLGGYILAEDVYAPQDVPFSATTSVDGYALRSSDPLGIYNVLTPETHPVSIPIPENSVFRINTGAPLPLGADAVIMVEDTLLVSTIEHSSTSLPLGEEKQVETLAQVSPEDNVRSPGSDVKKGDLVMCHGDRISRGGGEVGTLAFVGKKEVKVYRKPVIAILSTGSEIMDLHSNVATAGDDNLKGSWGGIFDTNRPSLQAVLEGMGYEVVDLGIVPDIIPVHIAALQKGLYSADLLLTTGGTSMGPTDLLKPLIERHFGGVVHFGRVSVKPGKPTTFASIPVHEQNGIVSKPVFALPGNPASALVTLYVFVIPALRMMGGWPEKMCELPRVMVQIQNSMPLDPRTEFHRVIIRSTLESTHGKSGDESNKTEMVLKAYSTGGQRSSRAASLCEANGLVVLPPLAKAGDQDGKTEQKSRMEVGEFVQAMIIGEIEMT